MESKSSKITETYTHWSTLYYILSHTYFATTTTTLTANARGTSVDFNSVNVGVERAEVVSGVVGEPSAAEGGFTFHQAVLGIGQIKCPDQIPHALAGDEAFLKFII